jgi:hypothetical protein
MLAVAIESVSWYRDKPLPPHDLGTADFSAIGLKGHLVTKWSEKAEYRVRFAPIKQEQLASFALLVNSPPRPLSISIHLSDSAGFVLCIKDIVLKFDFLQRQGPASDSLRDREEYVMAVGNATEHQTEWERDRDIFHKDLASDGGVEAISSQGDLPCSKDAYRQATHWNFSSNFPTTAEQDALLKSHVESSKDKENLPPKPMASHRNSERKANALSGLTEGDDVISGYSVASDCIETSGGLTFFIYKEGEQGNAIMWDAESSRIHYRCDENSMCTLTRAGTGVVLHAKLRK